MTHFGKLFQMCRYNFHQSTKYCYGQWNTFNPTFKVLSPNNLFKTKRKN